MHLLSAHYHRALTARYDKNHKLTYHISWNLLRSNLLWRGPVQNFLCVTNVNLQIPRESFYVRFLSHDSSRPLKKSYRNWKLMSTMSA